MSLKEAHSAVEKVSQQKDKGRRYKNDAGEFLLGGDTQGEIL